MPRSVLTSTDRGIPPTGYIEPGPDQHLDGFHALWFSRGRWGSDDYERMLRERCMVGAIVDAADPVTLVRRYLDLASAGKEIVRTDIPRSVLPALVNLGLRVKDRTLRKGQRMVVRGRTFPAKPGCVVKLWRGERRPLVTGPKPVRLAKGKVRRDGSYRLVHRFHRSARMRVAVTVASCAGNDRGLSSYRTIRVR